MHLNTHIQRPCIHAHTHARTHALKKYFLNVNVNDELPWWEKNRSRANDMYCQTTCCMLVHDVDTCENMQAEKETLPSYQRQHEDTHVQLPKANTEGRMELLMKLVCEVRVTEKNSFCQTLHDPKALITNQISSWIRFPCDWLKP